MKLPVQAAAVLRGSFSWPTRWPAGGSTESGIAPAGGAVQCSNPTPNACICGNGVAICCATTKGCTLEQGTGVCKCNAGG
jgi:hypothetical protein